MICSTFIKLLEKHYGKDIVSMYKSHHLLENYHCPGIDEDTSWQSWIGDMMMETEWEFVWDKIYNGLDVTVVSLRPVIYISLGYIIPELEGFIG